VAQLPCREVSKGRVKWAGQFLNGLLSSSSRMMVLLRMDAAEIVRNAGFDAVEAEAIAILEARPNIHVVFTDIQMPGSMDGLKLAKFVKNRWPPIKIVTTSGRVRIGGDDLPEGGRFLSKPYTPAEVIETLRQLTTG
jgi:two-component system, response regulator PdtaR